MAKSKTPTTGEVSRHPYRPLPPRGIIAIVRATRDKNVHRLPKQDPYSLPPRSAPGVAIHGRRAIKMSTACDPQPTVQAINQSNHINSKKAHTQKKQTTESRPVSHLLPPQDLRHYSDACPAANKCRRTEDARGGNRRENETTTHRETGSHVFDAPSRGATRSKGNVPSSLSRFLSSSIEAKGVPNVVALSWEGKELNTSRKKIPKNPRQLARRVMCADTHTHRPRYHTTHQHHNGGHMYRGTAVCMMCAWVVVWKFQAEDTLCWQDFCPMIYDTLWATQHDPGLAVCPGCSIWLRIVVFCQICTLSL